MVRFDWDGGNRLHIARHRILPVEAEECVLADPLDIGLEDVDGGERFAQLGEMRRGRILIVIATMRADTIRVVTAYDAFPQGGKGINSIKRPRVMSEKMVLPRFANEAKEAQ